MSIIVLTRPVSGVKREVAAHCLRERQGTRQGRESFRTSKEDFSPLNPNKTATRGQYTLTCRTVIRLRHFILNSRAERRDTNGGVVVCTRP